MPRKRTQASAPEPVDGSAAAQMILRSKPLVFVSHDTRDADIAEAFGNLLSDASGGTLKSFRSSDKKGITGIEFGSEWYDAIMTKLGDATDVVALLTKQSIDRPWILYEAGVAKGRLNAIVFGIAIGVPLEKVSTGPFGQFQNSGDDEDSLTKLVLQLLLRNPDATPREEAVRMQVRVFRDTLKKLLKKTDSTPAAAAPADEPSIAKLFEEVKVMVRDLPDKLEAKFQSASRKSGRRLRRFHPMMMEEFLFHPAFRDSVDGQAAAWLALISYFRDDVPWFYEVGLDVYRALRSNDPLQIAAAKESFNRILRNMTRGPLMRELVEDEDTYLLMRHLPDMWEMVSERLGAVEGKSKPRRPETPGKP